MKDEKWGSPILHPLLLPILSARDEERNAASVAAFDFPARRRRCDNATAKGAGTMATPQTKFYFTEEQYLKIEREAEEKHEYVDGQIYAMAGETEAHNTICVNLTREVSLRLKGKPCRVFAKDIKVRSGPGPSLYQTTRGFFSYPDVLTVCGEREFHDQHRDVLLNPNVIIEVLSKATESFDRGEKFLRYRTWLPSLTDYLLIAQDKPVIEHYRRQGSEWILATYTGLEASLMIQSIDCTLKLSEVYDQVEFHNQSAEISASEESNT
jgi:Uma2 family endonuclease